VAGGRRPPPQGALRGGGPLIFVTVGTHHDPFERLLGALGQLDPAELVVQYGPGEAPAGVRRAEAFMPFEQMVECFREAEKVITHAGVGSILCASREGQTPLVVPRRHDLGEHVDEHQAELTRALAARGGVVPVWDVAELAQLLAETPARKPPAASVEPALCPGVKAALLGP
jgi:UDP-N-acetylglucosamine--N-acetylmuramyl-(pentapeptide) pyrophosphoryl-undecaprenol N-acetylglucosamine transferase